MKNRKRREKSPDLTNLLEKKEKLLTIYLVQLSREPTNSQELQLNANVYPSQTSPSRPHLIITLPCFLYRNKGPDSRTVCILPQKISAHAKSPPISNPYYLFLLNTEWIKKTSLLRIPNSTNPSPRRHKQRLPHRRIAPSRRPPYIAQFT